MSNTRKTLRQRIGGPAYLGTMILSTATGGGSSTLLDTKNQQTNDFFNNGQLVVLTGPAAGDYRYVTDWAQSTGTFTADRAFTGTPASTNEYEVWRVFSATDVNGAINDAILDAKWRWPRVIEDESITAAASTYTYALAGLSVAVDRFKGIDEIYWASGTADTGFPYVKFKRKDWTMRDANATLTLQLLRVPFRASQKLRLVYRVRPAVFTADTGAGGTLDPDVEPFAAYICARASAMLCEKRAEEYWLKLGQKFQLEADGIMSADVPVKEPGRDSGPALEQMQRLDTNTREGLERQGAELELEIGAVEPKEQKRRTKK